MKHFTKNTIKIFSALIILLILFLFTQIGQDVSGNVSISQRKTGPGTVATKDDCRITITTYIAFAFQNKYAWEHSDQLIKQWRLSAESIWNKDNFTYGPNNCPVHFSIVTNRLDFGMNCDPNEPNFSGMVDGWHCINVGQKTEASAEVTRSRWSPVNRYGTIAFTKTASPNTPNVHGNWTFLTTGQDAAHAIGHLFGLEDDYIYVDENLDGNVDTHAKTNVDLTTTTKSIMGQTWGEVGPLRKHVIKIIELWGGECTEQCYCGNGRLDETQGEACDFKASENQCDTKELCNTKCQCVYDTTTTPECGDGYLHPNYEQCDPKLIPTGCLPNFTCTNCQCVENVLGEDSISVTPVDPPEEEPVPPKLRVSPMALTFSPSEIQKTITISNENGDPFSWDISPEWPDWIKSISPISPKPGNDSGREVVWITINQSNIIQPTHKFTLTVYSTLGSETVTLTYRE